MDTLVSFLQNVIDNFWGRDNKSRRSIRDEPFELFIHLLFITSEKRLKANNHFRNNTFMTVV